MGMENPPARGDSSFHAVRQLIPPPLLSIPYPLKWFLAGTVTVAFSSFPNMRMNNQ